MPRSRLPWATVLAAVALPLGSCTLVKPIVCAVTTPIYVIGQSDGDFCGCDARALACVFVGVAAVGAVGGLVTGIISDVNVLTGHVPDPSRNFYDPFATNRSRGSF